MEELECKNLKLQETLERWKDSPQNNLKELKELISTMQNKDEDSYAYYGQYKGMLRIAFLSSLKIKLNLD